MTVNLAVRAAYNERRKLLCELITLSTISADLRSQFSDGDDWTDNDDKLAGQLMELDDVLIEKATALSIAATRHKQLFNDSLVEIKEQTAN